MTRWVRHPSALARKGDEELLTALGAACPQEAMGVDAARQVGAELALDVARQTAASAFPGDRQKGLEVLGDEPV